MNQIRLNSTIKITANKPTPMQNQISLTPYIGQKCKVIAHWN